MRPGRPVARGEEESHAEVVAGAGGPDADGNAAARAGAGRAGDGAGAGRGAPGAGAPPARARDPYDISSFYRSSGGGGYFRADDGYGERRGNAYRDPYSIAGYYRSGQRGAGYGYSQFWVSGYSGRTRGLRYRRHIGENGDLFFFAPAILAPVGPLSEVFLGGR